MNAVAPVERANTDLAQFEKPHWTRARHHGEIFMDL